MLVAPTNERPPMGGITHPAGVALAAVAGLVSSWILATRAPIMRWELDVTEWLAGTPDPFAWMLYPNMVMGTIGGGLAISFVIGVFGRDRLLAVTMAVNNPLAGYVCVTTCPSASVPSPRSQV